MPSDRTSAQVSPQTVGRYRWGICGLLFVATMLNYIDRQAIGILKPELRTRLGWTEIDYSNVILAFQIAYAIGYAGAGRFVDRVGVRIGYAVVVLCWTLAAMAHALNGSIPPGARLGAWVEWAGRVGLGAVPMTVAGFCAARFALGLAEGGNFPAAIRTVSEWFPKKERALA
ncbi:MAG: MFS transporter, partial [Phycisphaerae bacterium]|nr:MFS transporter [Phycisphaerae bacterium]